MNINTIVPNMTELHLNDKTIILFSYNTAVAAYIPGKGYIKTDEYFSPTTSKHINKWTPENAKEVPQAEIDVLIGD